MKRYVWIILNTCLALVLSGLVNVFLLEPHAILADEDEYTLTVNIIGNGTVDLDPPGGIYLPGTHVTLTATAAPNWRFAGWSGDLSGKPNPKTITIDGNKIITASFTQEEYTLAVNTVGNGSVILDPEKATYDFGEVVQLAANANLGWTFTDWSGDLSGSNNPDTITIDGNKTVIANFVQEENTLSVAIIGNGLVIKNPDKATYNYGDVVQLTANANTGWVFSAWSGDLSGSSNPDTVTIDGNKSITATFTQTSGGGGGGGGGGMPEGVTFVSDKLNPESTFVEDITAMSYDKKVSILVENGTIGKTSLGGPLAWISIRPENDYPIPEEYLSMLSLVYDVAPYEATFEPPVKISIKFDPSTLDAGIDKQTVYIATCDSLDNEWYPLESHVEPENNIVWAEISHFSLYTVMVNTQPADISVTGITITPEKIYEGEVTRVDTVLVNSGASAGSYEVMLKIDGTVKDIMLVNIAGADNITVGFDLVGLAIGTHEIAVDNLMVSIEVLEKVEPTPATFIISSLEISSDEVNVGENVNVSVRVDNTGDIEGVYQLVCKVNGIVVNEKKIHLAGGAGDSVIFTLAIDESGSKTIEVNELSGSLMVKEFEEEPDQEGVIAEIPIYKIPDSGGISQWLLAGIVLGVAVIIIAIAVYLVKQNKI